MLRIVVVFFSVGACGWYCTQHAPRPFSCMNLAHPHHPHGSRLAATPVTNLPFTLMLTAIVLALPYVHAVSSPPIASPHRST
jgi:hypothetical protein